MTLNISLAAPTSPATTTAATPPATTTSSSAGAGVAVFLVAGVIVTLAALAAYKFREPIMIFLKYKI